MSSDEKPVADVLLELHRLGELPEALRPSVERRLAGDAGARERLDRLDASDREFLDTHPPERFLAAIRRRAGAAPAPRPARARVLLAVPAFAAVALAVVLVVRVAPKAGSPEPVAGLEETRLKGLKPHLLAYLVSGRDAKRLADGAPASAGNTLQLSYVSAGRRYGVIASIDGRGQVTLHLPVTAGEAARLDGRGGEVALPRTYQLDDAPDFERFFFVTSDEPFTTARVLEAGRALVSQQNAARGSLPLSGELEQSTLAFRKVSP